MLRSKHTTAALLALMAAACGPTPTPIPAPTLYPTHTPYPPPTEVVEIMPTVIEERHLTHFATLRGGQITDESGARAHPTWSPDGQWIAFHMAEAIRSAYPGPGGSAGPNPINEEAT